MIDAITVVKASFTPQSGRARAAIPVHFNPVSLQLSITNTLEEKGAKGDKKQYVTKSAAKLSMDLIFDTTDTGADVRGVTEKIARFMVPDDKKVPPVVLFEWGAFAFKGMVESYKETIDFFAPEGVPLRASVNLTLSRQEKVFAPDARADVKHEEPVVSLVPEGDSVTRVATRAGAPAAGRDIAAANGLDSMRFVSGPVALTAGVKLSPPVAFASGGAGLSAGVGGGVAASLGGGLSAGVGGGLSAGAGLGVSAGGGAGFAVGGGAGLSGGLSAGGGAGFAMSGGGSLSASAGAGFAVGGAGLSAAGAGFGGGGGVTVGVAPVASVSIGGSASAGVPASAGAFAGLRTTTSVQAPTVTIDVQPLTPRIESVSVASDRGATFDVGGRARLEATGLHADVGASANLRDRIRFGD